MASTLHLVDPDARGFVQGPSFDPDQQTVAEFRATVQAQYAQLAPPLPSAREERTVPGSAGAPEVRVFIYRPDMTKAVTEAKVPAILYFYGGGFITGTADMQDAAMLELARNSGAVVVSVGYRLAPEHPFPAPVEDGYAALSWLFQTADALDVDATKIAVMGDSSGGGLAAALTLLTRDRGEYKLAAQLLIYPMLDPRTGTADVPVDNPTTGEFVWTRKANRFAWTALRGSVQVPLERLGHFAPALADRLTNLPPTFIGVGSLDLFLEEDVAYALRLSRSGVPLELHVYNGGVHGFDRMPGTLAAQFTADLNAAISRVLPSG